MAKNKPIGLTTFLSGYLIIATTRVIFSVRAAADMRWSGPRGVYNIYKSSDPINRRCRLTEINLSSRIINDRNR